RCVAGVSRRGVSRVRPRTRERRDILIPSFAMRGCRTFLFTALVVPLVIACGSKPKPAPPPVVHDEPKPPPPAPVCVRAGAEMPATGSAGGGDGPAHFCIPDGTETNQCFSVDLTSGKLGKAGSPGAAQNAAVAEGKARVETNATEVKVCAGNDESACKTFKPA